MLLLIVLVLSNPTAPIVNQFLMVDKTNGDSMHGYLYLRYRYKANQSVYYYRAPVYYYRAPYHLVKKFTPGYARFQDIAESHPKDSVYPIHYNQIVNKRLWLKSVVILLRCYEDNEVGRGKKSVPTRKTLHSDKKEINLRQVFAPGKKIDLKQEFMIPSNAPLSTAYAVRYQVRWVLEIQVLARKSFDFHAEFPIEVAS
jgi:hypothetical protein